MMRNRREQLAPPLLLLPSDCANLFDGIRECNDAVGEMEENFLFSWVQRRTRKKKRYDEENHFSFAGLK
jgi:hypothetical protein